MSEVEGRTDGRFLADRYRLGEVLGKGGMGTVWRAVDETLGRSVAVKELRFPGNVDEDEKRRLVTRTLREAKASARIGHSGAITVFDVVKEDDRPWIVMELVEGRSLADVVREDGPLGPKRAAEVGLVLLDVLKAAHSEGILHRDVKPSNVLIADPGGRAGDQRGGHAGRVVLTDFGIAQIDGDPSVTSTGMLVGAPSYISPERARGQKPGPPADLWSLGALLYACVEGRPPYDKGSAIATLTAVMTEPVGPMPHAGPLAEVIRGLLDKDPAQRLDDAGARALLTTIALAPERPSAPPAPTGDARTAVLPVDPQPTPTDAPPPPPSAAPLGNPSGPAAPARPAKQPKQPKEPKQPGQPAQPSPAAKAAKSAKAVMEQARIREALTSVRNAARTRPAPEPGTPGTMRSAPPSSLTDVVPRRTLVIVAIVLALVVLGTVIGVILANSGDGGGSGGKGGGASTAPRTTAGTSGTHAAGSGAPSAGATPGGKDAPPAAGDDASGADDKTKGEGGPGKGKGSKDDGAGKGGPGSSASNAPGTSLPADWHLVTNPKFHFSIALPSTWKQTDTVYDSGVIYSASGGFPRVQIDFNSTPGKDAAANWRELEPGVAHNSDDYKGLGIEAIQWRGYRTVADWDFTRTESDGTRAHVKDRGFVVDDHHAYAIMVSIPAVGWNSPQSNDFRNEIYASFKSLP